MFAAIFIFLLIFSIVLDVMVYRMRVSSGWKRRSMRVAYVMFSVLLYISMAILLTMFAGAAREKFQLMMSIVMWVIWIFFINFFVKIIYFILNGLCLRATKRDGKPHRGYRIVAWILNASVITIFVYGATFGRTTLRVENVELQCEQLPAEFDGFRIVQFTDLHVGALVGAQKTVDRLVEKINELDADIVVQSGDLVNMTADELTPEIMQSLGRIKAREGVYASLGNHDLAFYVPDQTGDVRKELVEKLVEKQKELGWNILVNEVEFIERDSSQIAIAATSFPLFHEAHRGYYVGADLTGIYREISDSTFSVLISHTPELWEKSRDEIKSRLTLAGHVHSMQFKLNVGKRKWSPAKCVYPFWSGLYEREGKYLYVNDGIGYVMFPMRFGTQPEVTVIELRTAR